MPESLSDREPVLVFMLGGHVALAARIATIGMVPVRGFVALATPRPPGATRRLVDAVLFAEELAMVDTHGSAELATIVEHEAACYHGLHCENSGMWPIRTRRAVAPELRAVNDVATSADDEVRAGREVVGLRVR